MYASSEKKLDILNDHYKDTFSHLVSYRKQRDRLLLYLLGVVMMMFLYVLFPEEMTNAISEISSKKLEIGKAEFILPLLLKVLPIMCAAFLAFRYWQVWHLIESQYDYLVKLEMELAPLFSTGVPFTRESNFSYKDNRNRSIWSHKIYNFSFITLLCILILLDWIPDIMSHGFSWGVVPNIICVALVIFWYVKPNAFQNILKRKQK